MKFRCLQTALSRVIGVARSENRRHLPVRFAVSPVLRLSDPFAVLLRGTIAVVSLLIAAQTAPLQAQNIPPMIGDQVGKPKIRIPNPLERAQKEGSQSSQSHESTQQTSTAAAERDVNGFLGNWRSSLSRKDMDALSSCYVQTEALRVYWESQELAGWEPFKAEMQRLFASPEGLQLELKEPLTKVFGRFAWVTGRYVRQKWIDGTPKSQEGLLTLVLEKRRSLWIILHQHASAVSGTQPVSLSTE
ncbi:MAG: nuclear transport factor 2 family protein [Acidobacteria bacterium]|nr:nuclear transport factor 2 family protein [Acidobacteriota bacterium]MCI0623670.1 nuclear transport factor 2 family protein [Acidobacteriota bacterium]MCI0719937.1 nuclear transport factor 2 family protein [Acidobacteriota bacterium]